LTDLVKKLYLVNLDVKVQFNFQVEVINNQDCHAAALLLNMDDKDIQTIIHRLSDFDLTYVKLVDDNFDISEIVDIIEIERASKKFFELEKLIMLINTKKYDNKERNIIRSITNDYYKYDLKASDYEFAISKLKRLV